MPAEKICAACAAMTLSVGLSGCGDAPPPASISNPEAGSRVADGTPLPGEVTADDVQREIGEAVDTAAKYADQTREEYQQAMQNKLDALDADIEALQAKADAQAEDASEDARREYEEAMEALREKRRAMGQRFSEFKDASGDAWHDVAIGLDAAWDDLSAAFSNAADRFQENDAESADQPSDPGEGDSQQ